MVCDARTVCQPSIGKLICFVFVVVFRPFRTACLVGSAKLASESKDEDYGDRSAPLEIVYREKSSKVIKTMLEVARDQGEKSREGNKEAKETSGESRSGGISRAAARRLLGMDESDQAFLRVLQAKPILSVGDFMEGPGNLGLLRFSFNLNPAMVATVSAWARSEFS